MSNCAQYNLRLLGAFQLIAPDGTDVCLGKKAQALVAILAVENGNPVTRSRLQDLLWSLSGPKHGRDSLKKALQAIRKALDPDFEQFSVGADDRVRLVRDSVQIDVHKAASHSYARVFLEGLDISEPEFENWLRDMRQHFATKHSPASELSQAGFAFSEPNRRIRVAVRRPVTIGDSMSTLAGDVLLSRTVDTLSHSGLVEVVDLRDADSQSLGAGDAFLSIRSVSVGTEVQIQIAMRSASDNALLWSSSRHFDSGTLAGSMIDETVSRFVDEIHVAARKLSNAVGAEQSAVTRLAMDGIENLFRLAPENLERAAASFAKAIDIRPCGSLYAWYAFLMPFRYEQKKGIDLEGLRSQAKQVLRCALELDPYNPTVRSLIAHVYSFLFKDFEKADAVLAPLRNQPPDTPMYHFSESMLHLYSGQGETARSFALQAARNGRAHPYSYAFSTSLCMIDALDCRSEEAIRYGRRALAIMPSTGQVYEPTLRYLTVAYAGAGKINEARSSWLELQSLNPANSLEQMRESRFPIAADHMRQSLDKSLGAISSALI